MVVLFKFVGLFGFGEPLRGVATTSFSPIATTNVKYFLHSDK